MVLEKVRRFLDELKEKFDRGERRGLVVTLLAVARLLEREEEITAEKVRDEVHKIMKEYPDTDWGVTIEEYTPELAARILRELAAMGILEEIEPGTGRYRAPELVDPKAEVYARFGHLLFYGYQPGMRA